MKKKRLRNILVCITAIVAALLVSLNIQYGSRVKTMMSLAHIEGDLYAMTYEGRYYLDEALDAGIESATQLGRFLSEKMFLGREIEVRENVFGCSAFLAKTPEGSPIVGRNFDYAPTSALMLYTKPRGGGYESMGMVDLEMIGVGSEERGLVPPETAIGGVSMWAAPYACMDGVNEKGLCVCILELESDSTFQNTGKKPIITTIALRMMLDKCATVDEATRMLSNYDMRSSAGYPYHYLIADASGKCAVVEYPGNRMTVLDSTFCTNFQLSEGEEHLYGIGFIRYDTIRDSLARRSSVLSRKEAMDLLEDVKVPWDGGVADRVVRGIRPARVWR